MSRVLGLATLLAALALGLTTAGAGGGDDKDKKKFDPETTFKKLDTNGDGMLSKAEFLQIAEKIKEKSGEEKAAKAREFLGKVFDKLDTDNKGYLTLEQFKKFGKMREEFLKKKKSADK